MMTGYSSTSPQLNQSMALNDELERLRLMMGERDIWENPERPENLKPFMNPEPESLTNAENFSESDDDENILCADHRVGGRLQQPIDPLEAHTEVPDPPSYVLKTGDVAPMGEKFCPLQAIAKIPYQYVSLATRNKVADIFFAKGNLYERAWDFFYIWPPESLQQKPIILLPVRQVEHFLISINNKLRTRLRLPDNATAVGLLVTFPDDGTSRPRYLGRAEEREMAEHLKQSIPPSDFRPMGEPATSSVPTSHSLEAFKKRIEFVLNSGKGKLTPSKEKKRSERLAKQESWSKSLKRVQQYLGLRDISSRPDPRNPWNIASETSSKVSLATPNAFNLNKPVLFAQYSSVIFICIDVESYERDHNIITEIGIATLDTAEVADIAPGKGGSEWFRAIRARHFRIKEYRHINNREFIQGCADRFQFGESEWVSTADASQEISKCFKEPYSAARQEALISPIRDETAPVDDDWNRIPLSKRNIVLVGHDVITDVKYLRKLGYDISNLWNLQETVDTVSLYRSFRKEDNPRNLGSILANLNIDGWYLHNAGNDAVYTLQAMIGIAIQATVDKQDKRAGAAVVTLMSVPVSLAWEITVVTGKTRKATPGPNTTMEMILAVESSVMKIADDFDGNHGMGDLLFECRRKKKSSSTTYLNIFSTYVISWKPLIQT